jgi:hypothetical protein
MNEIKKLVLVDCDGVLLNWEFAFSIWLQRLGYKEIDKKKYNVDGRYDTKGDGQELVRRFNESAAIGFLPPLRDAVYYIKRLNELHGFIFHVITSLSNDPAAQKLRQQNLEKIFGEKVFDGFTYLDCGEEKSKALAAYKDSGLFWIEDKYKNAMDGLEIGLKPILMEHGHNMHFSNKEISVVTSWAEIEKILTSDE